MSMCFHIGSICLKTAKNLRGGSITKQFFRKASRHQGKKPLTQTGFTAYELCPTPFCFRLNPPPSPIDAGNANFYYPVFSRGLLFPAVNFVLSDHTLEHVITRLIKTNDRVGHSGGRSSKIHFRFRGRPHYSCTGGLGGLHPLRRALCNPGAHQDTPISGGPPFVIPPSAFRQTRQSECRLSLEELRPQGVRLHPDGCIRKFEACVGVSGPASFQTSVMMMTTSVFMLHF